MRRDRGTGESTRVDQQLPGEMGCRGPRRRTRGGQQAEAGGRRSQEEGDRLSGPYSDGDGMPEGEGTRTLGSSLGPSYLPQREGLGEGEGDASPYGAERRELAEEASEERDRGRIQASRTDSEGGQSRWEIVSSSPEARRASSVRRTRKRSRSAPERPLPEPLQERNATDGTLGPTRKRPSAGVSMKEVAGRGGGTAASAPARVVAMTVPTGTSPLALVHGFEGSQRKPCPGSRQTDEMPRWIPWTEHR